uniref:Uncharacterized protein n=1 Tax=Seriola dumerili TaxID=41447 RepID=A0A3B4T3I5_SERDU
SIIRSGKGKTQRAVKVEEHSRCVILTYFQGDTKSMVDAHFTRALSKDYKAMAPGAKAKKFHKTIKLGKHIKSTVYDVPDYKQDSQSPSSSLHGFFLCLLQKTTALVRASLWTLTQSHSPLLYQDTF